MDVTRLFWTLSITLLVIALIQVLYLIWLSYAPRSKRAIKEPSSPVMPTTPQNLLNTTPPSYGRPLPTPKPNTSKMIILSGLPSVNEIPLPGSNFGIGRFYDPDKGILVVLDEKSISRQHATFTGDESHQEYYLTDTNSSYGTAVRKENKFELLTPGQRARIYNEDVVQFGNVVTVRFVLPGSTRASVTRL